MGDWGLGSSLARRTPFFSRSPSPSPFTPATLAILRALSKTCHFGSGQWKKSRHAMLSGVCIVFRLTAHCCHDTLFHPARTFTTVCYFNPVKNPIKSHKTCTATNGIMLAQCLTIRVKIQICNLRNGVFLTSWLTRFVQSSSLQQGMFTESVNVCNETG